MDRCKVHPRSLLLSPRHLLGSLWDLWGRTVDLHNILPLCVVPDGVSEHFWRIKGCQMGRSLDAGIHVISFDDGRAHRIYFRVIQVVLRSPFFGMRFDMVKVQVHYSCYDSLNSFVQ